MIYTDQLNMHQMYIYINVLSIIIYSSERSLIRLQFGIFIILKNNLLKLTDVLISYRNNNRLHQLSRALDRILCDRSIYFLDLLLRCPIHSP